MVQIILKLKETKNLILFDQPKISILNLSDFGHDENILSRYATNIWTKTATTVPSIDSTVKPGKYARSEGRRSAKLPDARVCVRHDPPMALSRSDCLHIEFSEMLHHCS